MSTQHVDEQLAAFALGTLSSEELPAVESHIASCPRCAFELYATRELLAPLALGQAPVPPAPSVRKRLLEHLAGGGRLHRFAERVALLLEITVDAAKSALERLDAPDAWAPLPIPGAQGISFIIPPAMGPSLAGFNVAFLRIPPGVRFPTHTHMAAEQVLILQGGYVDEVTEIEYGPGDIHAEPAGSTHSYRGIDGPDCYCLGVVTGRVQVGELVI